MAHHHTGLAVAAAGGEEGGVREKDVMPGAILGIESTRDLIPPIGSSICTLAPVLFFSLHKLVLFLSLAPLITSFSSHPQLLGTLYYRRIWGLFALFSKIWRSAVNVT